MPTKVRPVKAMVFPVVMYGCERWTIKKAHLNDLGAFWTKERPINLNILKRKIEVY